MRKELVAAIADRFPQTNFPVVKSFHSTSWIERCGKPGPAEIARIPYSARDNELWTAPCLTLRTIENPGTHCCWPFLYSFTSLVSHHGRRERTMRQACSKQASGRSRVVSDLDVADTHATMCFLLKGSGTQAKTERTPTIC
jgi:hypothetical protein